MGLFSGIKDTVDEAVDKAQDTVEEAKDTAGEVAEKAGDVAEKATGSDLDNDGSVGKKEKKGKKEPSTRQPAESSSQEQASNEKLRDVLMGRNQGTDDPSETVEKEDIRDDDFVEDDLTFESPAEQEASMARRDLQDMEGVSSKDISSGIISSNFEEASENREQARETKRNIDKNLDQLSPQSLKQDVVSQYEEKVDEIGSRDNFSQTDLREQSAYESRADQLKSMSSEEFKDTEEFQQAEVTVSRSGETDTVSVSEARDRLQNTRESVETSIDTISENQDERARKLARNYGSRESARITSEDAENIARQKDFSEEGFKPTFLGRKFGEVKGPAAEAALVFDAVTSGGEKSADVFGAAVDQYIGSDKGDKTVEQVAEENLVLNTQRLQDGGFDPVEQAGKTVTSVPGLVGASAAGGAAFSGVVKGAGALPKVAGSAIGRISTKAGSFVSRYGSSAAKKGTQLAGIGAGAYSVAKQGAKIKGELEAGRDAEAVGTLAETGAGFYGFYKGQQKFNTYLGARTGSTRINQKNLLRETSRGSSEGFGRFKGETKIIQKNLRSPVDAQGPISATTRKPVRFNFDSGVRASFRSPVTRNGFKPSFRSPLEEFGFSRPSASISTNKPVSFSRQKSKFNIRNPVEKSVKTVNAEGRYGISGASRSGSQVQGQVRMEYPSGSSNLKSFESVASTRGTGSTRTGNKYRITEDTVRFKEQGRLFRNFRDSTSVNKNIRTSRSESSADEVVSQFSDVAVKTDSNIFRTRIQGVSSDSTVFSDSTNYFIARAGRSGGPGSSGGSGLKTGGSGGGGSVNVRVQELLSSDVQSFVRSQNPTPTGSGGGAFSVSGSGSEAGSQAGMPSGQIQDFGSSVQESSQRQRQGQQQYSGYDVQVESGAQSFESGQIQERSRGQDFSSGQVSSTAKELNEDFKDTSSGVSVERPELDERPGRVQRSGTGQVERNTQDFDNFSGLQQLGEIRAVQGSRFSQQFGFDSVLDSEQVQGSQFSTTTGLSLGGGPGAFGFDLDVSAGSGSGSGRGEMPGSGLSDSVDLDWLSANRVEQSGGEARFDVSDEAENPFFGLKTVQEKSGRLQDRSLIDDNGGDDIW